MFTVAVFAVISPVWPSWWTEGPLAAGGNSRSTLVFSSLHISPPGRRAAAEPWAPLDLNNSTATIHTDLMNSQRQPDTREHVVAWWNHTRLPGYAPQNNDANFLKGPATLCFTVSNTQRNKVWILKNWLKKVKILILIALFVDLMVKQALQFVNLMERFPQIY